MAKSKVFNVFVNNKIVFTGSYRTAVVVYDAFRLYDSDIMVFISFCP